MEDDSEIVHLELSADLEAAARQASERKRVSLAEFITEAVVEKLGALRSVNQPRESISRHRCLLYKGNPSRQLPMLAAVICEKLKENYRCLYLSSPTMVAEMESCLAARGRDVLEDTKRGKLALLSDQHDSGDGIFDVDAMLQWIEDAIDEALKNGYKGLWASGDMAWEFGRARDFSRLLEYERRLEELSEKHPEFEGICQYHADTLPAEAIEHGRMAHRSVFVSETLSLVNAHYRPMNA